MPTYLTNLFGAVSPFTAPQQIELARSLVGLNDFAPAGVDSTPPAPAVRTIQTPLDLRVGDRFDKDGISARGRFELLAKIGQGGMGAIFKVFDYKQQRVVGMKVLLKSADAEAVMRFDNEIKIGSRLDHDHLVTVYETIEFANDTRAMLMKFIEGRPLSQVMHQLTYRQAADILLDVASGVSHMHSEGIIHRDLKPDNILIRASDGRAFVADYGISKLMKEAPSAPESLSHLPALSSPDLTAGGMIGTIGYFDPGESKNEPARDLFALGNILYQLMSGGRQAFRSYKPTGEPVSEPLIDLARRIHRWIESVEMNRNPDWRILSPQGPATKGTDYAESEILRIVNKCLRRTPKHRFRGAADFMADLLTVKTASLKRDIDAMERRLEDAMKIELPVFLLRSGVSIDPALNPAEMSDKELSDLLHCPVSRKDGKIFVNAGTRDFLPPLERQALDDLDLKLERTINLWRTEIGLMASRILAKGWPLKHLIATTHFDFVVHEEYELSRAEIDALVPWVTDYETPLPDGKTPPMTRALTHPLPVFIDDMRDYTTGEYVQTPTDPKVRRLAEEADTGQYWEEEEELDIAALSLQRGDIFVLRLRNADYAPVAIPIQASLKQRKELLDRGLPLTVAPELIPKGHVKTGFTVIHGGTSMVGVRYGHKNGRYGIPEMEFSYGPFAVKTATLGDYIREFILPLVKAGRKEAEALAPRAGSESFLDIDWENKTIDVHEKDRKGPKGNPIALTQNVRGVTPNDLFSFARYLGLEIIDSFRWEVVATNGIRGFISPTGTTVLPIYLPCFNNVENWYRDPATKIERPRNPDDIQIPEMDAIPPGTERSHNITLVHGVQGTLGPGLHATSTPGTIDNIVTKSISITATTDAVSFNARKEQMRPKHQPFQISDYAALLMQRFTAPPGRR
ncbi:MAG TPA: serine/threonine-protein kinase [bacterium]|nr:serine/threonine-protein kinase [bacterium]